MHISEIDLINIRSYKKEHLAFSRGINLFIGPNNSGKSTILRCLQNLQQGLSPLTKNDVRKSEQFGKILYVIEDIAPLQGDVMKQSVDSNKFSPRAVQPIAFSIWNDKPEKQEFVVPDPITSTIHVTESDIRIDHLPNFSNEELVNFKRFPNREDQNNFIYPFLSKRKVIHYSGNGGGETAFGIQEGLQHLPSRIQNLTNGSQPNSKKFQQYCQEILGFQIGKVPHDQTNEDRVGIFVNEQDRIFLDSMGEGVANILGLLSILLTRNNKLYLIEEIENDIHPKALKQLLNLIIEKSASNQFIISTHSNIVLKYLGSAPDSKVFYTTSTFEIIDNIYGEFSVPTSTIKVLGNSPAERRRILEDLGYELFDFDMYSSYIIFEESSAERFIRDFLIPNFIPDLMNKIKTIAAGGASEVVPRFIDFHRLFTFIHSNAIYENRAWVIVDGDPAGQRVIQQLKGKFTTWPESNFRSFSKMNFEEYYPSRFKTEVDSMLAIDQKDLKRNAKIELTNKVLSWINKSPEEAVKEFGESAREVIELLEEVNGQIIRK